MAGRPSPARLVLVGKVAGAFGVKGEVRLVGYTETPLALLDYRRLLREDGSPALTLTGGRAAKPGEIVARAEGIVDKDGADALRGVALYVRREALPAPAEDEFYLADLIGLEAVSPGGEPLGRVKAVLNHGASDILEIEHGGRSRMIAFTLANVPTVDTDGGILVLDSPAEIGEPDPGR